MNWGLKLAIVYCAFVIMIGFMVFKSALKSQELVESNYYEQELKYQDKIDGMRNAENYKKAVSISHNNQAICLNFSTELGRPSGSIKLFKPDNETKDLYLKIKINSTGQQIIRKSLLSKGVYLIKIQWVVNNLKFYKQYQIKIN